MARCPQILQKIPHELASLQVKERTEMDGGEDEVERVAPVLCDAILSLLETASTARSLE